MTRDRILDAYLNEAYLGRGAFGVAAGATAYFGKKLDALDIDEIAFLTARLRMPSRTDRDRDKRNDVIDRMRAAGLIDERQAVVAKAASLPWLDNQPRDL